MGFLSQVWMQPLTFDVVWHLSLEHITGDRPWVKTLMNALLDYENQATVIVVDWRGGKTCISGKLFDVNSERFSRFVSTLLPSRSEYPIDRSNNSARCVHYLRKISNETFVKFF